MESHEISMVFFGEITFNHGKKHGNILEDHLSEDVNPWWSSFIKLRIYVN
jgi:hypothetical protein